MNNYCQFQGYKEVDEATGKKFVYCYKNKCKCICQRFCTEQQEYIVSEQAKSYCKDFKKI